MRRTETLAINLAAKSFFIQRHHPANCFNATRDPYGRRRPQSAWRWRSEPCWGSPGSACRERASIPGRENHTWVTQVEHNSLQHEATTCPPLLKSVTTYCKVPLEGFGPSVVVVPTYFTVVVDVESVEFVEPVRDWLEEEGKSMN